MMLQTTGYDRQHLFTDAALGLFDGIDSVLWCYGFAAIVFGGALAAFLPLGLPILLGGWALLGIVVALTSRAPVHMIAIDEQAVVIVGSIALLLGARLGEQAASPRGLATLLAIIAAVSLLVAAGFLLAGRLRLAALLELMPYPVICGFMAGIAWLLFDAGVMVALERPISIDLWAGLRHGEAAWQLSLCLAGGLLLAVFTSRVQRSWALPAASAAILIAFFAAAWIAGRDLEALREAGWIFDVRLPGGGPAGQLAMLRAEHIDVAFLVSVLPEMLTVVFLALLGASMNLSAMTSLNVAAEMNSADEFRGLGGGNLLCGLIGCPPGYTDAPASLLYEGFGARTRWMPLASSGVCLAVAASGAWFVNYTPKLLIGATVFLFAFQLSFDWLYARVRHFNLAEYAVICAILLTVIAVGFMQGILLGFLLTVLVFVLRYSMIPVIHDQYTLIDRRSSVERSLADDALLQRHGGEALVFTLRGYLFFGTANGVRDRLRDSVVHGRYRQVLLDLGRVTGIDVSALNALAQIRRICAQRGVRLLYACDDPALVRRLRAGAAVGDEDGAPAMFELADYALENMEERLIAGHGRAAGQRSLRDYLWDLLPNDRKIETLLGAMRRTECAAGECLFRQGDEDDGLYVLESGYLSATIASGRGAARRVKKFSPGSVIGELSNYTLDGARTATVTADTPAVLYRLDPTRVEDAAIVHELVARTLGARMEYMNRRLLWELT